jgi:hypothetical protein
VKIRRALRSDRITSCMVGEIITAGCHSLLDVMTVQSDIMRDRWGTRLRAPVAGAAQSQSSDREVIQSWVKQVMFIPTTSCLSSIEMRD